MTPRHRAPNATGSMEEDRVLSDAETFETFATHYGTVLQKHKKTTRNRVISNPPRRSLRLIEKLLREQKQQPPPLNAGNLRRTHRGISESDPGSVIPVMALSALRTKRKCELMSTEEYTPSPIKTRRSATLLEEKFDLEELEMCAEVKREPDTVSSSVGVEESSVRSIIQIKQDFLKRKCTSAGRGFELYSADDSQGRRLSTTSADEGISISRSRHELSLTASDGRQERYSSAETSTAAEDGTSNGGRVESSSRRMSESSRSDYKDSNSGLPDGSCSEDRTPHYQSNGMAMTHFSDNSERGNPPRDRRSRETRYCSGNFRPEVDSSSSQKDCSLNVLVLQESGSSMLPDPGDDHRKQQSVERVDTPSLVGAEFETEAFFPTLQGVGEKEDLDSCHDFGARFCVDRNLLSNPHISCYADGEVENAASNVLRTYDKKVKHHPAPCVDVEMLNKKTKNPAWLSLLAMEGKSGPASDLDKRMNNSDAVLNHAVPQDSPSGLDEEVIELATTTCEHTRQTPVVRENIPHLLEVEHKEDPVSSLIEFETTLCRTLSESEAKDADPSYLQEESNEVETSLCCSVPEIEQKGDSVFRLDNDGSSPMTLDTVENGDHHSGAETRQKYGSHRPFEAVPGDDHASDMPSGGLNPQQHWEQEEESSVESPCSPQCSPSLSQSPVQETTDFHGPEPETEATFLPMFSMPPVYNCWLDVNLQPLVPVGNTFIRQGAFAIKYGGNTTILTGILHFNSELENCLFESHFLQAPPPQFYQNGAQQYGWDQSQKTMPRAGSSFESEAVEAEISQEEMKSKDARRRRLNERGRRWGDSNVSEIIDIDSSDDDDATPKHSNREIPLSVQRRPKPTSLAFSVDLERDRLLPEALPSPANLSKSVKKPIKSKKEAKRIRFRSDLLESVCRHKDCSEQQLERSNRTFSYEVHFRNNCRFAYVVHDAVDFVCPNSKFLQQYVRYMLGLTGIKERATITEIEVDG